MQPEKSDIQPESLTLEERIARLEGKVGWRLDRSPLSDMQFGWSCGTMLLALGLCYAGVGAPNHVYQLVLAILFVLLSYDRNWLSFPLKWYHWGLTVLNTAVLAMLFKLMIGGGTRHPFFWMRYPAIQNIKPPDAGGIGKFIPQWQMIWQDSAAASYTIDLTILQTFLLLITIIGALFTFQPFVSLTALLLVIISIPSLMECNWDWVFPAIVAAAIGLYLQQSPTAND